MAGKEARDNNATKFITREFGISARTLRVAGLVFVPFVSLISCILRFSLFVYDI